MKRTTVSAVLIPAGLFFVAMWPNGAAAEAIAIGTNQQGSLNYAIGSGVALAITKRSSLTVRPVGFGGSTVFMPRLNKGSIELAVNNVIDLAYAYRGTGTHKGNPQPNIRLVAKLVPLYVGLLARVDSGIKSIEDFKGKPFPTDFSRQKIVKFSTEALLATAGLGWGDIKPVPVATFGQSVEYLVTGKVVGANGAPGASIVRRANARQRLKFISVQKTPQAQAVVEKILPGASFVDLAPARHMPTIHGKTTLLSFPYMLVTNSKTSDAVIYQAVKALHGARKDLIASHGIYRSFRPKNMASKVVELKYHPGAIKFYKEMGMWPPKD